MGRTHENALAKQQDGAVDDAEFRDVLDAGLTATLELPSSPAINRDGCNDGAARSRFPRSTDL
jgi:hypothetical protein